MLLIIRWAFLLLIFISCSKVVTNNKSVKLPVKKKSSAAWGPTLNVNQWFTDKTAYYGLASVTGVHFYAVDFDSDSYTDLVILPDYYSVPRFFKFMSQAGKFKELDYNPFNENHFTSFLNFADFNKDGVLDVLISTLNQKTELPKRPIKLFYGKLKEGRVIYQERPKIVKNGPAPTSSISLLDYNLDGHLDIFVGNWFTFSSSKIVPQHDFLLQGSADGTFLDISNKLSGEVEYRKELKHFPNARPTFGSSTCDVDQNGFPDILTTSSSGYGNKMWLNISDFSGRRLKDFSNAAGYAADIDGTLYNQGGGNSFFSACTDYNNDGLMDIFVGELTHSSDLESRDRSSILTGSRRTFPPKFIRTEYISSEADHWSQGDRRAIWADFNLDGLVDLLVDNSGFPPDSRLVLFMQNSDHSFEDKSEIAGVNIVNPVGSVVIDLNRDGKLDIITGQNSIRDKSVPNRVWVLMNNIPSAGNRALRVHLKGKNSNVSGLGALITLTTNWREQRRYVEYSQGALPSQNEEGMIFGLQKKEEIKSLKVTWPIKRDLTRKSSEVLSKIYKVNWSGSTGHKEVTLSE